MAKPFSNLAAIGDVLASANQDVFIIDPYADGTALTKFAVFSHEGVSIRVLGDRARKQPSLLPAMTSWTAEYGARSPLSVRLSKKDALHIEALSSTAQRSGALGSR